MQNGLDALSHSPCMDGFGFARIVAPCGERLGVSPLRGAGLSRCASSHWGTGVSTLTGFHP